MLHPEHTKQVLYIPYRKPVSTMTKKEKLVCEVKCAISFIFSSVMIILIIMSIYGFICFFGGAS